MWVLREFTDPNMPRGCTLHGSQHFAAVLALLVLAEIDVVHRDLDVLLREEGVQGVLLLQEGLLRLLSGHNDGCSCNAQHFCDLSALICPHAWILTVAKKDQ